MENCNEIKEYLDNLVVNDEKFFNRKEIKGMTYWVTPDFYIIEHCFDDKITYTMYTVDPYCSQFDAPAKTLQEVKKLIQGVIDLQKKEYWNRMLDCMAKAEYFEKLSTKISTL